MLFALGLIFILCSEEIISLFLGFEVIFFYLNTELLFADIAEVSVSTQAQLGLTINMMLLLIAAAESAIGLTVVMAARHFNTSIKMTYSGERN